MQALGGLLGSASRLRVLCIGAHCDDIEIGCGATLLRLAGERELDVSWLVLCSTPARAAEAEQRQAAFAKARRARSAERFRDGHLPGAGAAAGDTFEAVSARRT
jgi:LmbE family N-acetylglucosaminyl deacetylase